MALALGTDDEIKILHGLRDLVGLGEGVNSLIEYIDELSAKVGLSPDVIRQYLKRLYELPEDPERIKAPVVSIASEVPVESANKVESRPRRGGRTANITKGNSTASPESSPAKRPRRTSSRR